MQRQKGQDPTIGHSVNETAKTRAGTWAPVNTTRWGRHPPPAPLPWPSWPWAPVRTQRMRIERTKAHILTRQQHGPDLTETTCTATVRTTWHAASISSMRASSGITRSRSLGSPLNLPFPSGSPAPAQAVTLAPVSHRNARRRAGQTGRGGCAGEGGLTSLAVAGQIRLVVIALASCCAHCQHLPTR